ncbi:MucR family transcriptional regulator [Inquilinus limosus]|uniref:MucR family transcriptional regulator n=1 Tax=Inquilinus limosus TaxID=171674 RepID=A0A211ZH94_9PROT|nr:MucR family transcriptional regulator [Inquilinus limosus]OWJ64635.1 MucR family transcriptional regulator [Inquilinus limosus]
MSVDDQRVAPSDDEIRALTAKIVSAHVGNNSVAISDLPSLIVQVHGALSGLDKPVSPVVERPQPAVPIKKSVTPEWIVCLEDGKKLKMLKRHLSSAYGMTPEQYRERWGLPADYPMVAPGYAQQRSALAKAIGLGTRRNALPPQPAAVPAPAKRSRSKKSA